jgi:hypothetical protein
MVAGITSMLSGTGLTGMSESGLHQFSIGVPALYPRLASKELTALWVRPEIVMRTGEFREL